MKIKKLFQRLLLSGLFLILTACGTSPKTNFYLLSSQRDVDVSLSNNISIGVWKVKLPELIDRPEIVTHTGQFTVERADFHRWAGELGGNVSALIANEISDRLQTSQVDVSPWSSYRKFDYQVKVHVRNFLGELGGQSVFEGVYIILNGQGKDRLVEKTFSLKVNAAGKTYQDMAASMSELVVQLSDQMASSIKAQAKR